MLQLITLVIFSYIIGSVPSAYIAGRLRKSIDIRKAGTGNVGATNTLIVIGPTIALIVYVFDLLKGLMPVLMAREIIGTDLSMGLCGLAAILGHDYPSCLRVTGGKGVATTTGAGFGLNANVMWMVIFAWFIILVPVTNYFIIASLVSMLLIPILMYYYKLSMTLVIFGWLFFLVGLFTHRKDVVRILKGQHPKAFESAKKYFKR